MKTLVFFFICFLSVALSSQAAAQACGGGSYVCQIYILNGQSVVKDLKYEIFAIPPAAFDSLRRIYEGKYYMYGRYGRSFEQAVQDGASILPDITQKLLRTELPKKQRQFIGLDFPDSSDQYYKRFTAPRTGIIQSGTLSFNTYELAWKPCIIKLTSAKSTLYLLCNPFGGCSRETVILWNEGGYPQVANERQ